MKSSSRANVASSFAVMQGALIEETYALFRAWDSSKSVEENLALARDSNVIAARSNSWFSDMTRAILRRLEPAARDGALVQLAKRGCSLEVWKPILLWHMTREEFLLRDFLENWLFHAYEEGQFRLRAADVLDHLRTAESRGGVIQRSWTLYTLQRVARALLKTASEFGLLKGGAIKEFASFHLPEHSFLYLLHAMRDEDLSPGKVVGAPDWRMFLMRPADVEHELLRLHQFRKLDYQVAGSLVQLSLPCASSREYAERMVA